MDGAPAAGAVAAGFTLLQRSAPLVRALAGRRSAILLPPSGALVTALAASDGRGAALLPQTAGRDQLAAILADASVGAVFTTRALATRLPSDDRAVVLLDDAPRTATVIARGVETVVDLGSHFGLDLEGEEDAGSEEECVISYDSPSAAVRGVAFTHRNVFALSRGAVDATSMIKGDHVLAMLPPHDLAGLAFTIAAPLLAGARVTTMPAFEASAAVRAIAATDVSILVGDAAMYAAIAAAIEAHGLVFATPVLRVCVCLGDVTVGLQEEWHRLTGVELRQAIGMPEAPLALFNAPHFPNRRGALGVPFPGLQVSVRDAHSGAPIARGAAGELWLRGDLISKGALHSANVPAQAADGWLPTYLSVRERPDGAFERAE